MRLDALKQLENINFDQLRMQMDRAIDMKWENLDEATRKQLSKEDWEKAMNEARKTSGTSTGKKSSRRSTKPSKN